MNFKVGDIIRCTENIGFSWLKYNKQYEVTRVWNKYGNDFVDVRELGSKKSIGGFYPERFELVTKKNTNIDKY
jgi:hypothetical protein